MSAPDLTSIPLPLEPSSAGTMKKTAYEMLQEAIKDHKTGRDMFQETLKDHKSSSGKTFKSSSKLISTNQEITFAPKVKLPASSEAGESSQSIVDELFKDFIARKFSHTSRDTAEARDESTISRVRNSADEISKILDMEINSIRSHTESKDVTKQQEKLIGKIDHKPISSSRKSKFNPTFSSGKRKQSEDVFPSNFVKDTSIQFESPSLSSHEPTLISDSENIVKVVKNQYITTVTDVSVFSERISTVPSTVAQLGDTSHLGDTAIVKDTPNLKDTAQSQTNENSVIIKRNIMLPTPLAKKMAPPKVLGVKLSTQSLSLITSTDRIDREGRVWEEGEVQSSHSENSEKEIGGSDSEQNGFPSDSGSVNSNAEDWKTQSSKHKKKHKRKHKKKKKKSAREAGSAEKDRHRESKDKDREKSRGRGKDKDESDKDRHKAHSKDDRGNENTLNNKSKDDSNKDVKELEKLETHQSKGEREKEKHKERSVDSELEVSRKKDREDDMKRKRSNSRSKSPKRHKRSKSRSRSRSKSPKRKGSWSSAGGSRYSEWDARRYSDDVTKFSGRDRSRSRSRSKERSSDRRRRSRDDSRSRQKEHSKEGSDRDLRLQIDKAKLRKIAIANALQNMRTGQGPQIDLTQAKSGGKSVEELTEFCKRISEKGKARTGSEFCSSSEDDVAKQSDDEDLLIHHPFKMKEATSGSIVMNIRNAKQLPVLTPSEKQAQQATLRLTFPVSSGSHHRASESEWVPVVKTPAVPTPTPTITSTQVISEAPPPPPIIEKKVDSIFPHPSESQTIDIGSIISERLQAVRKLQENPFDMQALSKMHEVQAQASKWATSKHLPGQFTGSTGAHVLSQEQLIGNRKHQAWVKKTQLSHAAPVNGGIGMFLLQKMGWKQGEGLGKNNEGNREPLMLDIKVDRRGLTTPTENHRHKTPAAIVPRAKDLSNKHPVSALMELCNRRRWGPPLFIVVSENGPDHKKSFLFKVMVNNVEYQPSMASSNKKTAKAQCAAICLQEMGLLPRDAPLNI